MEEGRGGVQSRVASGGGVGGGGPRSHHHDVLRQDFVRAAGAVGELRLHRALHHLELRRGEPLPAHAHGSAQRRPASGGRGDASRRASYAWAW